eukprot:515826_1
MALCLKRLCKIDKRTKYVVCGWIRNNEKLLKLCHIPLLISSICILYFRDDEIFVKIGTKVKLSNNNKCIEKIVNQVGWENCSYGITQICSKHNIVCQWDLKIKKIHPDAVDWGFNIAPDNVIIGVTSHEVDPDTYCSKNHSGVLYLYCNDGNRRAKGEAAYTYWDNYGMKCGENDKVSVCLDLKNKQVKFLINDIDQGVAFENINTGDDIKYTLFVSLYG